MKNLRYDLQWPIKLHRGKDWIEDWKSNPILAKSWDWIGFQSLFLPEIGIGIHSHFWGLANSLLLLGVMVRNFKSLHLFLRLGVRV